MEEGLELSRRNFLKGAGALAVGAMIPEFGNTQETNETGVKMLTKEEAIARGMDPKVLEYTNVLIDASEIDMEPGILSHLLKLQSLIPEGVTAGFVDSEGVTIIIKTLEGSDPEGFDIDFDRSKIPIIMTSTSDSTYKVDVLYFPANDLIS